MKEFAKAYGRNCIIVAVLAVVGTIMFFGGVTLILVPILVFGYTTYNGEDEFLTTLIMDYPEWMLAQMVWLFLIGVAMLTWEIEYGDG